MKGITNMETKIPIDKKFIKQLNDVNQDLKNIFNVYYILPKGIVAANKDLYNAESGSHVCVLNTDVFDKLGLHPMKLSSSAIFEAIKNHKKNIEYIKYIDNMIYLCGDNVDIKIGYLVDVSNKNMKNIYELNREFVKLISSFVPQTNLTQEEILSLTTNQRLIIDYDNKSVRIARKIIPGLKKTHSVSSCFYDNEKDKSLFTCVLKCERATLDSYHFYTVLNYNI